MEQIGGYKTSSTPPSPSLTTHLLFFLKLKRSIGDNQCPALPLFLSLTLSKQDAPLTMTTARPSIQLTLHILDTPHARDPKVNATQAMTDVQRGKKSWNDMDD
jgi:hypothetical protein